MRTFGVKGLLLVVGYAVLYLVLREASVSHWLLPAGLRFAALLFLPYRFWPVVIAGDLLGSTYYRADRASEFGAAWFITALIGPIVSSALPVLVLRFLRLGTDFTKLARSVVSMLIGGIGAAVLSAAFGILAMRLIHYSAAVPPLPESWAHFFAVFTIGDYLGILVIAPAMLSYQIYQRARHVIDSDMERSASTGYGWFMALSIAFLLVMATMATSSHTGEMRQLARVAMFFPVVVMTYRHGWLGAVPTVLLGNIALQATMQHERAPDLVDVQFLMTMVGSAMLLLGATVTEFQVRTRLLTRQSTAHLKLARANLQWGEMRASHSAAILESAYAVFDCPDREDRVDLPTSSASEKARMRWVQAGSARRDLQQHIETLRMGDVHSKGLRMALLTGPIATTLEAAGVSLAVRVSGEVRVLPADMHVLAYRLIHDFVMRLTRDHRSRKVRVRLMVGRDHRQSLAIVVKVKPGDHSASSIPIPNYTTFDIRSIAQTYHGIFHDRSRRRQPTLSLLLRSD